MIETLSRLTSDTAASEFAVLKVFQEELSSYQADAEAYNRRSDATRFVVRNIGPNADTPAGQSRSEVEVALEAGGPVPADALAVDDWFQYAHTIDGYNLARLIGLDLGELVNVMDARFQQTGQWRGSLLDLRLALFFKARAFRHWGVTIEEAGEGFQREITTLLAAIAAQQSIRSD